MTAKWYEALFTGYAESYDRKPFTQGTADRLTPDDFEMLVVPARRAGPFRSTEEGSPVLP